MLGLVELLVLIWPFFRAMAYVLSGLWASFLKTLSLFLYVLFWHGGIPWLLYGVMIVL